MTTTLTIQTSNDVPDSTYFRVGSAEPELTVHDGQSTLTIYSGQGRRRGWGQPGVTSTVVLHADDLVAVHVGFHHKHGGGQFWRYYVPSADGWRQVQWASLRDALRAHVLAASRPVWANVPGKLRADYKAPVIETRIAYKIVRVEDDGRMVSLFDGATEYTLGKRLAERAMDDHRGGYYSYPSADSVRALFDAGELVPARCYCEDMRVALLEVEISGTILDYGQGYDEWGEPIIGGKLASTYLRPVRVLDTWSYQSAERVAC